MKKIIKYLPDTIVITGVWILSYNLLRPSVTNLLPSLSSVTNYHTEYKVLGIVLITIGIDMIIRKYLNHRVNNK